MKKYTYIFYFLLTSILFFCCQARAQVSTTIQLNELAIDKMAIIKSNSAERTFSLTGTAPNLVTAFGKPQKITKEYSEVDNYYYQVYRYDGAEFSFYKNALIHFDITKPAFFVQTQPESSATKKQYTFQVGDPVKRVQASYPLSYNAKVEDRILFWLTALIPDKTTEKVTRTRMDTSFVIIHENGRLTRFIYEE